MIDQQPSKTPTTDEAEALGPVTVLETCRAFEVGIKELRQRISTANAEVERLRQWEQALTEAAERLNTRVMEIMHTDLSRPPASPAPRTDSTGLQCPDCFEFILVPSIGDYYRCPKCNTGDWSEKALCLFKKGVAAGHKQLETELSTANAEVERLKKDHEDDCAELCAIENALGFRDQMVAQDKSGKLIGVHQAAIEKLRDLVAKLGELEDQRDALLANSKALAEVLEAVDSYADVLTAHNKLMEQFK